MSAEELTLAMEEACERLISFLNESKVPAETLHQMEKNAQEQYNVEEVLDIAEELGYCMAYMRHDRLVRLLKTGWKAACAYKALQRKKAYKACAKLEADNKTDPQELEDSRRKRDEIDNACAVANLKLYKLQVLQDQMDDESESKENVTSTEPPDDAKK